MKICKVDGGVQYLWCMVYLTTLSVLETTDYEWGGKTWKLYFKNWRKETHACGSKRKKELWIKWHNDGLYDMYLSINVLRLIGEACGTYSGDKFIHGFVGEIEKHCVAVICVDGSTVLTCILDETGGCRLDWSGLGQGIVAVSCWHCNEHYSSIKCREYLNLFKNS